MVTYALLVNSWLWCCKRMRSRYCLSVDVSERGFTKSVSLKLVSLPSMLYLVGMALIKEYIPSSNTQHLVLAKSKDLVVNAISLDFAVRVTWNLEALVNSIVDWFHKPILSRTSKVGILSFPQFQSLIKPHIDENTTMNFQAHDLRYFSSSHPANRT
jgi:hypothetical protein